MERREFLKLTLGFAAAAGSIAAMAAGAAQAAPMLPPTGDSLRPGTDTKPAESATQGKADPVAQTDMNAVDADDTEMSSQRRYWRRRRRYIVVRRRPRRIWRRRRVIYF